LRRFFLVVARVCAFISTTVGVLLTGGFHEDGLADLADGLGGVVGRERALEIMKDSRIGTFGALALILALVGKLSMLSMLADLDWRLASLAIFAAHVLSRTTPLYVIASLQHVGDAAGSKSKPLADRITRDALVVGVIWCAGTLTLVWWAAPDAGWGTGVVSAGLATWWVRRLLNRRLGGFTGDGLGTVQQVSELAFYLGVAVS
jgi:adenosylcobinamide-GDP ribazoletransferase